MRSLRCPDCSGEAILDDADESKHVAKCWQCGNGVLNVDDAVLLMQQIQWRLTDLETNGASFHVINERNKPPPLAVRPFR